MLNTKLSAIIGRALIAAGTSLVQEEEDSGQVTPRPEDDKLLDTIPPPTTPEDDKLLDTIPPPTTPEVKTDKHGVAFNVGLCGKAQEPFYKSGPRSGQWKKRKSIEFDEYDRWYAVARSYVGDSVHAPAAPAAEPDVPAAPKDLSGLMNWISEKTAAGLITHDDVTKAYASNGVTYQDVMDPDTGKAAEAVRKVWTTLSA